MIHHFQKRFEESDSMAVGLAIGIPSFLVLVFAALFWYRNHLKQNREDKKASAIDLELQDNESFVQFEQELHRPGKPAGPDHFDNDGAASGSGSGSSCVGGKDDKGLDGQHIDKDHEFTKEKVHSSSNSNTNSNIESTDFDMNMKRHSKNNSAYDFYETFIPILPNRESSYSLTNSTVQNPHSQSQSDTQVARDGSSSNVPSQPTTPIRFGRSNHKSSDSLDFAKPTIPGSPGSKSYSQNSSATSLTDKDKRYSLDNLAKQLNQQSYFEKLPSRANTYKPTPLGTGSPSQPQTPKFEPGPPSRLGVSNPNNSSNELVNRLVQNDAINESYVYGANSTS